MRPPENAGVGRRWLVDGVHPRWKSRPLSFHVGHYAVTDVTVLDRNPQEAIKPNPGKPPDAEHYAFSVQSGDGRAVRGDCRERVLERVFLGLGQTHVGLDCVCTEGERVLGRLRTADEDGRLRLASGRELTLREEKEASDGEANKRPLGFVVEDPAGPGGVDLKSSKVAWVPASVASAEHVAVACAYAGLLLHRPWR